MSRKINVQSLKLASSSNWLFLQNTFTPGFSCTKQLTLFYCSKLFFRFIGYHPNTFLLVKTTKGAFLNLNLLPQSFLPSNLRLVLRSATSSKIWLKNIRNNKKSDVLVTGSHGKNLCIKSKITPLIQGVSFNCRFWSIPSENQRALFFSSILLSFIKIHIEKLILKGKLNSLNNIRDELILLITFLFRLQNFDSFLGVKLLCKGRWINDNRTKTVGFTLGMPGFQSSRVWSSYKNSVIFTRFGSCSVKLWISYK